MKRFSAKRIFGGQGASDLLDIFGALKQVGYVRVVSVITAIATLGMSGLIYVVPALSSQASSTNDIIFGGLDRNHPKESLLQVYDSNHDSFGHTGYHALFDHYGITRENLASTHLAHINSSDHDLLSLGRNPHSVLDEQIVVGNQTYYQRPLYTWGEGVSYDVLEGQTSSGSWFAVMLECGNIVIKTPPPPPSFRCVDLEGSTHQGKTPLDVHFTATPEVKRTTVSGFIFRYGDGSGPDVSQDRLAHHVYTKDGTYTATVQVKTPLGTTQVIPACSWTVRVTTTPPPAFDCVSLTADKTGGDVPLDVHFNAAASVDHTTIKDFIFKFGDGTAPVISGDHLAHHIYLREGTYTATVQVQTPLGTTDVTPACSSTIKPTKTPPPPKHPRIEKVKSALNLTQTKDGQPIDATSKPAKPGDVIEYHLVTKNVGDGAQKNFVVRENINDILEYADVTNTFGGTLQNGILTWPAQDIAPHTQIVMKFRVKVKDPLPAKPQSVSDPQSFDLKMDNIYGNKVRVRIKPPAPKQVEQVFQALPQTGNMLNIMVMAVFTALAMFFYMRNRQLLKEVAILRGYYDRTREVS